MNDPFQLPRDPEILAELSKPVRESVDAIVDELVPDAKVARVIGRAQAAWAAAAKAGESSGGRLTESDAAEENPSDAESNAGFFRRSSAPSSSPICIVVAAPLSRAKPPSLLGYVSQVGPFSYLVSALVMGFALVAAWQYKVASRPDRAESDLAAGLLSSPSLSVGYVSGMDDCEWMADAPTARDGHAPRKSTLSLASEVSKGRMIHLESGLFEITYKSGVKVLLEGPAVFEADWDGGFLVVGKLTGRMKKAKDSETRPASSFAPFVIRTPTAIVTDLGTEFGVEVDRDGQTSSYVFQGAVRLHPIAAAGDGGDLILQANQAGRIAPKKNRPASVSRVENVDSSKFVRRLTRRRIPIPVFSTGAIAKPGESDPHWQVAAMSNDPAFTPQPAIVAKHGNPKWTVDDSGESRWIMTLGEPVTNSKGETNQLFPRNGTTCVFRTAFELREVLPETAVLHGWFVVDDHIVAIRLNGRDCEVPEHVAVSSLFHKFTIRDGFIEGTNVLEIEVANSSVDFPPRSPLGLRAEFDGSVVQRH